MNKSAFALLIISFVFMLTTCQFKGCVKENKSKVEANHSFQNVLGKEKAEKMQLVTNYESSIHKLKASKDSLLKVVDLKKMSIASYRFKASYYEEKLKQSLTNSDTLNKKEISSTLDSLLFNQNKSDTACDETIKRLEQVILNRDSVIGYHEKIEISLKEIQRNEEINTALLTGQLNDNRTQLRKKTRQNKILSAGLFVLSGITITFLISHHLK